MGDLLAGADAPDRSWGKRSNFPRTYAAHEAAATHLYATITGTNPTHASLGTVCPNSGVTQWTALPAGFALPAGTLSQIAIAIGWALQQLGTPYSYGGDCTAPHSGDPARECDCSSLTQKAYAAAHVDLPRTAADQSRAGIPVPLDQVHPGDLLFSVGAYGTTQPGHVALSLGNGYILEAPHTGATVRLTRIQAFDVVSVRRVVTPS